MREYLSLNYMEKAPINKPLYYIPHAIIKEDSTTTKVRVVFGAFCKTSTSKLLNDVLIVGLNL